MYKRQPLGAIRFSTTIIVPGDLFNRRFKFQYSSAQNTPVTITTSELVVASTDIAVIETDINNAEVLIKVGKDGSANTIVGGGAFNSDRTNLDLTALIQAIPNFAVNEWYEVRFEPNKLMRMDANLYLQLFINSRVV